MPKKILKISDFLVDLSFTFYDNTLMILFDKFILRTGRKRGVLCGYTCERGILERKPPVSPYDVMESLLYCPPVRASRPAETLARIAATQVADNGKDALADNAAYSNRLFITPPPNPKY